MRNTRSAARFHLHKPNQITLIWCLGLWMDCGDSGLLWFVMPGWNCVWCLNPFCSILLIVMQISPLTVWTRATIRCAFASLACSAWASTTATNKCISPHKGQPWDSCKFALFQLFFLLNTNIIYSTLNHVIKCWRADLMEDEAQYRFH